MLGLNFVPIPYVKTSVIIKNIIKWFLQYFCHFFRILWENTFIIIQMTNGRDRGPVFICTWVVNFSVLFGLFDYSLIIRSSVNFNEVSPTKVFRLLVNKNVVCGSILTSWYFIDSFHASEECSFFAAKPVSDCVSEFCRRAFWPQPVTMQSQY